MRSKHMDSKPTPIVDLHQVDPVERRIVRNMYPLFIHDQWAYSGTLPNKYGIIGSARCASGRAPQSLEEQAEMLLPYWSDSEEHHAFLIRCDLHPAGFCLFTAGSLAPEDSQFYIDELFLLHPFRRMGVGTGVVHMLVAERSGRWCVDMKAGNLAARAFWLQAATSCGTNVESTELHGEFGPVLRIQFEV